MKNDKHIVLGTWQESHNFCKKCGRACGPPEEYCPMHMYTKEQLEKMEFLGTKLIGPLFKGTLAYFQIRRAKMMLEENEIK